MFRKKKMDALDDSQNEKKLEIFDDSPRAGKTFTDKIFKNKEIVNENFQYFIFTRLVANKYTRFVNVDFSYCIFDNAYMRNCVFDNCKFIGCKFAGSNFLSSNFVKCNFEYANFEKTFVDVDSIVDNLSESPNLRHRMLKSLRVNFQQLGDIDAVNRMILLELDASEQYLRLASFSDKEYILKKHGGFKKRTLALLRLINFHFFNLIWGNGEKIQNLILFFVFILITIVFYDMLHVGVDKSDSIKYLFNSIQKAPVVFFINIYPDYYSDFFKTILVFLKLFIFALFTSIIIKRLNRR